MINKFCFLVIFFYCQWIAKDWPISQWVVWNVGQGQWVTYVQKDQCWHFDFGGEKNPIDNVAEICGWRQNLLVLSHADRDHFNFLPSILKRLKQVCLIGPSWKALSSKKVYRGPLHLCPNQNQDSLVFFLPRFKKTKNDNLMRQILYLNSWLIPGDAPMSLEKEWLRQKPQLSSISKLVLGHHGSKTSTSTSLLAKLPNLSQCVASSRQKKYGHPHQDVRIRIKNHCGLVRTEDWNHLHYLEGL